RIEFFGDEIDRIVEIDYVTGKILGTRNYIAVFPASHYVTTPEKVAHAVEAIEKELSERVQYFKENDKLIEAQRIEQRTKYDIEMLNEIGTCQGIENYSRHITGREEGEKPYTLMSFFPDDFLLIVDESHVTIPQVRGMYAGDRSRKQSLIENGFRLPSAYDNRPLNFSEFEENINQVLFVSATPGSYEIEHSTTVAQQIIRPTGLLDPIIEVRPIENQIDNLVGEINKVVEKKERVLITTLTKKMSEDLTNYLKEIGIRVKYLHSDIDTLERTEIIRDLRLGKFDVLVGINLLREGLDIPEVSLVAILDADKEGFLRSETSLIQTVGRAARNSEGRVIMYADKITRSMSATIEETKRRREIQSQYNEENGITPKTIVKEVRNSIETLKPADEEVVFGIAESEDEYEVQNNIETLQKEMMEAAQNLQFERAAQLRDKIK
ncbi:helicase-related protein, partial [Clostridium perfringens]|uniref:helicase-related protein n=1 Tax=Clostridium perfringens TaxID=1502 RepID=UPI00232EDA07